ncbi:MAG: hypothetical protein A3F10_02410 [Coxiella sp. RIFCSPHIGHO2_12_FULL_42_15]|nr:MAG: hypothetical protein A3F10_02410 [Coxiella sp. RIFCSPHIGHO2_12_FULL_42_15]
MCLLLEQLQQWYATPPGQWLLQFEQEQANKWVPLVRGATVLQMGGLPDTFSIAKHASEHYYFLSSQPSEVEKKNVDLIAHQEELPFLPNSVNVVLLVHVLEYAEHPTAVLKEVFDILAPNGKLLLFCFNPWSLWGMHKLLSKNKPFPWKGKFISPARLQNWLISLGFSNLKDKTLCFRSPYNKRRLTRFAFFCEALGQITIPMLGAVSVFLVEKRVLNPLRQQRYQWRKQRAMVSIQGK